MMNTANIIGFETLAQAYKFSSDPGNNQISFIAGDRSDERVVATFTLPELWEMFNARADLLHVLPEMPFEMASGIQRQHDLIGLAITALVRPIAHRTSQAPQQGIVPA